MVSIDPTQLGLEFGSGAAIGALMGFTAKKVAKLVAVLVGAELALFKFLETKGLLVVRWDKLSAGLLSAPEDLPEDTTRWIEPVLSSLSIGGGFAGGFYLGFRRG
jgi:uncharacterized membrane protein (Fun14 family)